MLFRSKLTPLHIALGILTYHPSSTQPRASLSCTTQPSTQLLGLAERLCFPPCPHPYPLQWLAGQGDMGGGGKQSPGSREEAEAPGEISEAESCGCSFWWSLESGGGEGIIVPGRRQDSFVPRALATRTKLFSGFAVSPAGEVKGRLGAGKAGPPALQTWGGGQGPPPQCFRLTRRLLGATR